MKRIIVFVSALLLVVTLVGCGKKEATFDFEKGVLVVGMEADYPPFNWYESDSTEFNVKLESGGYVDGYDVQIAKLIAEELELELVIKALDWKHLISALRFGDIDLIIAGMSPTEERKESINFTTPYYSSNHIVVVKRDGQFANITSLADLENARGVGQINTIYAELVDYVVEHHGATANPVRDNVGLMVLDILNNDADFMVVETPVALLYEASHPNLKLLFQDAGNIFNVSDEERDVSIGVRKGDSLLLEKLNLALTGISLEMRNQIMSEVSLRAEIDE